MRSYRSGCELRAIGLQHFPLCNSLGGGVMRVVVPWIGIRFIDSTQMAAVSNHRGRTRVDQHGHSRRTTCSNTMPSRKNITPKKFFVAAPHRNVRRGVKDDGSISAECCQGFRCGGQIVLHRLHAQGLQGRSLSTSNRNDRMSFAHKRAAQGAAHKSTTTGDNAFHPADSEGVS